MRLFCAFLDDPFAGSGNNGAVFWTNRRVSSPWPQHLSTECLDGIHAFSLLASLAQS